MRAAYRQALVGCRQVTEPGLKWPTYQALPSWPPSGPQQAQHPAAGSLQPGASFPASTPHHLLPPLLLLPLPQSWWGGLGTSTEAPAPAKQEEVKKEVKKEAAKPAPAVADNKPKKRRGPLPLWFAGARNSVGGQGVGEAARAGRGSLTGGGR